MRQCSRGMKLLRVGSLLAVLSLHDAVAAFGPISVTTKGNNGPSSFATTTRQLQQQQLACFYNDFEGYNDHDDDDADAIDVNALGDWRAFRRNLAFQSKKERAVVSVSSLNEELLASQSKELAQEYKTGVWAHTIATPEVGGLLVRLPLEAELYRNRNKSITGRKLHESLVDHATDESTSPRVWYETARSLVEQQMVSIAEGAGDDGQIDPSALREDDAELLQLYLEHQETWQEVCLVLERDSTDGTASALVLNRPMAFKLTANLAQLVLYGAFQTGPQSKASQRLGRGEPIPDFTKFMRAFGDECGVYIGGPDDQDEAAELIHGVKQLFGAVEISHGSGIYRGGLNAAIDGVLDGSYTPMDFRFFVGKHSYTARGLDLAASLGKYQPVACARSLALKQCISLPKPLWHEVLEICDGEMKELSLLELSKRDDIRFQIVNEDDEEEGFYEDDDEDIPDELSELFEGDDDDEEYF